MTKYEDAKKNWDGMQKMYDERKDKLAAFSASICDKLQKAANMFLLLDKDLKDIVDWSKESDEAGDEAMKEIPLFEDCQDELS
jgi:hypothetical protein